MRTSRNVFIGLIVILIGLNILSSTLGLGIDTGNLIGPLIFFVISLYFYQKNHRILSMVFLIIGLIALFDNVFHINIAGVFMAMIFIYFGYRLLTGKPKEIVEDWSSSESSERIQDEDALKSTSFIANAEAEHRRPRPIEEEERMSYSTKKEKVMVSPTIKSSFIGDIRLTKERFELRDMNIRNGIGDIKIDLSRAIINEGETVIVIHGLIGDIDIYVPYDLDVSVQASVTVGDIEVFENRQSGFNRNIFVESKEYSQSPRRIKIVLSLFIGDLDVRYV